MDEENKMTPEQEAPKRRGRKPKTETVEPEAPVAEIITEGGVPAHEVKVEDSIEPSEAATPEDTVQSDAVSDAEGDQPTVETEPEVSTETPKEVESEVKAAIQPTDKPFVTLKKPTKLYRSPSTHVPYTSIVGLITIESGIPQNGYIKVSTIKPGIGRIWGYIDACVAE